MFVPPVVYIPVARTGGPKGPEVGFRVLVGGFAASYFAKLAWNNAVPQKLKRCLMKVYTTPGTELLTGYLAADGNWCLHMSFCETQLLGITSLVPIARKYRMLRLAAYAGVGIFAVLSIFISFAMENSLMFLPGAFFLSILFFAIFANRLSKVVPPGKVRFYFDNSCVWYKSVKQLAIGYFVLLITMTTLIIPLAFLYGSTIITAVLLILCIGAIIDGAVRLVDRRRLGLDVEGLLWRNQLG